MIFFHYLDYTGFVVNVLLGVLVLAKNWRSPLNIAVSIFLFMFAIWCFALSLIHNVDVSLQSATLLSRIGSFGWIGFASQFLVIALIFSEKKFITKKPYFLALIYLPAIALIIAHWQGPYLVASWTLKEFGWRSQFANTNWTFAFYLYYVSYMLSSFFIILSYTRKSTHLNKKKQGLIIVSVTFTSLLVGSLSDVILPLFGIINLPNIANLMTIFWSSGIAYAIIRYKLLFLSKEDVADNILEAIPSGFLLLNKDGEIQYLTNQIRKMFHLPETTNKAGNILDLLLGESNQKLVQSLLSGTRFFDEECSTVLPDKETVHIRFSSEKLDERKHYVSGFVCVMTDITEIHKTQENLRLNSELTDTLLNNAPFGLALNQISTGIILYRNQAFLNTYRINEEDCQTLSQFFENVYARSKEQGDKILEDVLSKDPNRMKWEEISLFDSDDKRFYVSAMNINLEAQDLMISTAWDVTNEVLSKQQNQEIQKQIIMATKLASIGELASGVGHEINNPLTIIVGYLETIRTQLQQNHSLQENIQNQLDLCKTACLRIRDIVNGLRTYSRADIDEKNIVDFHTVILDTLSFIRNLYEKEGVQFTLHLDTTEAPVLANHGKLQQVLINLLSNARDATEGKSDRKIQIRTRVKIDEVVLVIEDNGVGISSGHLEKIFDTFYTSKPIGKGTGLGLSIVRNILKHFHSTISLQSELGKGTSVVVCIPLSDPMQSESETLPAPIEKQRFSGRALIVDDEADIREILTAFLEEFGLEVDIAVNGFEALDKIHTNTYQYLFTDIKMPKMDGLELLSHIKKMKEFHGKLFVITGSLSEHDLELDVDGYIRKPFESDQLYQTISQTILKSK